MSRFLWPRAFLESAPWFRYRPRLTVGVAFTLYAAVFALRMSSTNAADAYSMLYVFPVALLALAFGTRIGLAAGAAAIALTGLWAVVDDVSLPSTAWASRVVPLLLLGILLGDASDRARRSEREKRRLESAALLHREAIEINDSIVQGITTAKWLLESGNLEAGERVLSDTLGRSQDLVSNLIRRAGMGGRTEQF